MEPPENFILLNSRKDSRSDEVEWIKEKVHENSSKGIRTIVITLYDLIPPSEFYKDEIVEKDVYLVRMLSKGGGRARIFEEKVMAIGDDITQLELILSDIIRYANERKIYCQIVLYTISWLIKTHGWKRVYSLLTSIMSELKNSTTQLICFYYSEAHEDKTEISSLEKLSDRVMEI